MAEPRPDFGYKGDEGMPSGNTPAHGDGGKFGGRRGDKGKGGKSVPISARSVQFRLSFSLIVTCVILQLIICFGMFTFGVMVGRGQNPEKQLPQFAQLLPGDDAEKAGPDGSLGDGAGTGKIMQPEDLRYAQSLKGQRKKDAPKELVPVTPPAPAPAGAGSGQIGGDAAPATQTPPPAMERTHPQQGTALTAQTTGKSYDFVYQVATLRDEDSVDRLRARLEDRGLRTKMVKDKKLYKVMVLVRGTDETAKTVQQQMMDMKLGQPLQRSKTPVKK